MSARVTGPGTGSPAPLAAESGSIVAGFDGSELGVKLAGMSESAAISGEGGSHQVSATGELDGFEIGLGFEAGGAELGGGHVLFRRQG